MDKGFIKNQKVEFAKFEEQKKLREKMKIDEENTTIIKVGAVKATFDTVYIIIRVLCIIIIGALAIIGVTTLLVKELREIFIDLILSWRNVV